MGESATPAVNTGRVKSPARRLASPVAYLEDVDDGAEIARHLPLGVGLMSGLRQYCRRSPKVAAAPESPVTCCPILAPARAGLSRTRPLMSTAGLPLAPARCGRRSCEGRQPRCSVNIDVCRVHSNCRRVKRRRGRSFLNASNITGGRLVAGGYLEKSYRDRRKVALTSPAGHHPDEGAGARRRSMQARR